MQLCIFEDDEYYKFEPLIFSRPVFDLKIGSTTIREKISKILKFDSYTLLFRDYLKDSLEYQDDKILKNEFVEDDYLFINGRIIPDLEIRNILSKSFEGNYVLKNGDVLIATFLEKNLVKKFFIDQKQSFDKKFFSGINQYSIDLKYFTYIWEVLYKNELFIEQDFNIFFKKNHIPLLDISVKLINEKSIFISDSAKIGFNVILDASKGPIIIDDYAQVMHNSVVSGPCYIGKNSLVKSNSQIYSGTSIGDFCKVAGEISNSIILDYSNKQHDGFLGHSYLGSWVNLGAGTITSNLKNNYSKIQVELSFDKIKTDIQFLGLLAGDHLKSAIGTRFNTSTVVGFCCNVFGEGLTNKFIPSFSWGSISNKNTFELDKAIELAKIVYARRGKEFNENDFILFEKIFNDTKLIREKYGYK